MRMVTVVRHPTIILLSLFLLVPIVGCMQTQPPAGPPVVNAGPDQTVNAGATVTLSGSATDPGGLTLTYAWTQTAGTAVTLTNPNTATAVFTAPATAGTLTFRLTALNTAGLVGTDEVNVTVSVPTPTVTPQLFVANFNNNSVASITNPATRNGAVTPDTVLQGASTLLNQPADIAISSAGDLLVSNFNAAANRITSYANATTVTANTAPQGNLQGAATGLANPASLAVNATGDLLFVANLGAPPRILVYTGIAGAAFNGNLAFTRQIATPGVLTSPTGINLATNGDLYVANNGTNTILVYADAANKNGANVPADRTITGNPGFSGAFDVFVDANDRMYVVSTAPPPNSRIDIYNNASTIPSGARAPDFTLRVQGAPAASVLTSIVVDSAGRGFITEFAPGTGQIYSYDGIATLNGTVSPTRTITSTSFNGPIRLFLRQ